MCRLSRYYEAWCGWMWLDGCGCWLPVRLPVGLPRLLQDPAGMQAPARCRKLDGLITDPVCGRLAAPPTRASLVRSLGGPPDRPLRTGPRRRSGRAGPCGPGRCWCWPHRPRPRSGPDGRHRVEDRVRPGLPAASHLALAAPGQRHHPLGRGGRGLRRVRVARLAREVTISRGVEPILRCHADCI